MYITLFQWFVIEYADGTNETMSVRKNEVFPVLTKNWDSIIGPYNSWSEAETALAEMRLEKAITFLDA